MASPDMITTTHDHETPGNRESAATIKSDASSSTMSTFSSPENTRQKTTAQNKTSKLITRESALALQLPPIQGPALFSIFLNGEREPRAAPFPRDAVVARSDLNAEARAYCEKLRVEAPKICFKVFAPFDIRTFFDEYDFERLGGEFLYETLILLWKENGKRVVDFCQNWAMKNEEAFHQWFEGTVSVGKLFATQDQEEYGYEFLDKALMCMKECYDAAAKHCVTETLSGSAYQHDTQFLTQLQSAGGPFQIQNTNVANAHAANQIHAYTQYATNHGFVPNHADHHRGYENGFVQQSSQNGNNKKSPKKKGSKSNTRANVGPEEYHQPGPHGPASTQHMVNHFTAPPSKGPLSMPRLPSLPMRFQPHTGGAPGSRPMYPPSLSGAAHGFEPQRGYYQTMPPPPDHGHASYPEVGPPAVDRNGSMRGRRGGGYADHRGGSKNTGSYRRSSLGQSGDGNDARDEVETRRFTAHPESGQKVDSKTLRMTMSHPMVAGPWIEIEQASENDAEMRRPSNIPGRRIESWPGEWPEYIVDRSGSGHESAHTGQVGMVATSGRPYDGPGSSEHRPRDPLEVWVGSIPEDCAEKHLYAVLSQRAEVKQVTVVRRDGAQTFAFVRLANDDDVRKILQPPNIVYQGFELVIRPSKVSRPFEFMATRPALRTPPQQAYKTTATRSRQTSFVSADTPRVEVSAHRYSPQDARSSADSSPRCDTTVPVLKSWANIASKAATNDLNPLVKLPSVPAKVTQKHKENVTPMEHSTAEAEDLSSKVGRRDRRKEKIPVIRMPPAVSMTLSVIGEAEEPVTPKFNTVSMDEPVESAAVPDSLTSANPQQEDEKASKPGAVTLEISGDALSKPGPSTNEENVTLDTIPDSAFTLQSPEANVREPEAPRNEECAALDVKAENTDFLAKCTHGDAETVTAVPIAAPTTVSTDADNLEKRDDVELQQAGSIPSDEVLGLKQSAQATSHEVSALEHSAQATIAAQPDERLKAPSHLTSTKLPATITDLLTSSSSDTSVDALAVDEPRSAVAAASRDSGSKERGSERESLIDIAHLRQRLTKVSAIKAQGAEVTEHLAQVEKCKMTVDNLETREKELMDDTKSSKTVNRKKNQKIKKLKEDYEHVLDEIEFIRKYDKEPEQKESKEDFKKESKDQEVSSSYPPVKAAEATFVFALQPAIEAAEYTSRTSSYPAVNAAEATLRLHPATEPIDRDGADTRVGGLPLVLDDVQGSRFDDTAGRMQHVWNHIGEGNRGNRGKSRNRIASGIPDFDVLAQHDQQSMLDHFPHRGARVWVDSPLATIQPSPIEPTGLGISSGVEWPRINATDATSTEGTVSPVSSARGPATAQKFDTADTEHAAELCERLKKLGPSSSVNTPRHMTAAIASPPKSPGPHSYARAASSTNLANVLAAAESSLSSAGAGSKRKVPNAVAAESNEQSGLDKGKQRAEDDWKAPEEWGPGGFRKQGGGDRVAGEGGEAHRPKSKKKGKAKTKAERLEIGEQSKGG